MTSPLWKRWLIGPYYYGTLPLRRWRGALDASSGRAPVMIVFYHRVADDEANAWTISHRLFRQQILWMRRYFELVSLAEAQRRIKAAANNRPCVSITFDDGYADNCRDALPWLLDQGIPFTYFVTADHVLNGAPFPHDLAMNHRFLPNSVEQLRELAEAGVEIGAHSRTHANLGAISDHDALYDEVVAAGEDLARAIGVQIRYFAFPFGLHENMHVEAFRMARAAGYAGVCSAYGGYNLPGGDAFHLQRIGAEGSLLQLKNWLTNSAKARRISRFEYDASPAEAPAEAFAR